MTSSPVSLLFGTVIPTSFNILMEMFYSLVYPRRTCAVRVTVLGVCLSVHLFSDTVSVHVWAVCGHSYGHRLCTYIGQLVLVLLSTIKKNLIKQDIWAARRFNNTVSYIDDLLTLNNRRFECAIDDIYPPELQLMECPTSLSYFDIMNNGKYSTAVYNKRDNFNLKFLISPACVLNQHMVYIFPS